MYLQDITPEILEKVKRQLDRIEKNLNDSTCDYWRARWKNNCSEKKGVYIDIYRCYLSYRCSRHRGNFKKLSEKEIFYLKCL